MKTHLKHALAFFALLICAGASAQTLQDAIRLTDNEQYEKAKSVFRQLIVKDPTNGDNFFYFGDLMLKAEDPDSAKILFQKGIDINATNPLTHVGMARYMMATGNPAGGEKEIVNAKSLLQTQAGKTIDPARQIKILLAIAETEIMSPTPNFDDAIKLTTDAENLDKKLGSKNADIFLIRGDVLYAKDRVNGTPAITSYIESSKRDPHSSKAYLRIGGIYLAGKNPNSAIGYFNLALKADSTFAPAWALKGEAEYQMQRFDSATYCYNKYLKLNDDPWARYRICINYYKAGDYDNAIIQGNLALSKDSSLIIIYRILGRSYLDKKASDPAMSISSFNTFFAKQKIAGKPPLLPDDYIYRAKAYSKLNQDSLAILDYNTAMKVDTARHDIYFEVGTAYYKMKKYDLAAM
jgi:tetratricopeptide (TPR) repeat protein